MRFLNSAPQILAKYVLNDQSAEIFFLDADQCYCNATVDVLFPQAANFIGSFVGFLG